MGKKIAIVVEGQTELILVGKDYRKKKEDVEKIVNQISKEDYQILLDSNKCKSFNQFHETIFD